MEGGEGFIITPQCCNSSVCS